MKILILVLSLMMMSFTFPKGKIEVDYMFQYDFTDSTVTIRNIEATGNRCFEPVERLKIASKDSTVRENAVMYSFYFNDKREMLNRVIVVTFLKVDDDDDICFDLMDTKILTPTKTRLE